MKEHVLDSGRGSFRLCILGSHVADETKEPDHILPEDREPDEAELDQFLAEADPEFALQMATLEKDRNLKAEDIVIDDATQELFDETQEWENSKGLRRLLFRFMPGLPRLSLRIKKLGHLISLKSVAFAIGARNITHDIVKGLLKGTKYRLKRAAGATKAGIGSAVGEFKALSGKRKAFLLLTILFIGALVGAGYFVYLGKLIPRERDLFIANFEEMGAEVTTYDPSARQELFYDNVRSTPNLFLIPKMVVNIKASVNSGENPMLAVEFFAEGMSPEVILELKDREAYFRDLMQRRMEDYTFDYMDSKAGKQELTAVLLKDLNRSLTQGQLRALRIKTLILKP